MPKPQGLEAYSPQYIRKRADYQKFELDSKGNITNVKGRMIDKQLAFKFFLPNFKGLRVLDIGCDFGFWCFYAASNGASKVMGIDRSRNVRGLGHVDLIQLNCELAERYLNKYGEIIFQEANIGIEFPNFSCKFDFIFLCSLYHHIYANCGDHDRIFNWINKHSCGQVLWENPVDLRDPVAKKHIPKKYQNNYCSAAIINTANKYFNIINTGPAIHEPYRQVLLMEKKDESQN